MNDARVPVDARRTFRILAGTPEGVCALMSKLSVVMGEVGRIEKKGRNDFHHYDYVRESDIADRLNDLLSQHGIGTLFGVEALGVEIFGPEGKQQILTTALGTVLIGDENAVIECPIGAHGMDRGDKGCYKAFTGAMKYFSMKSFHIATGDDPEGDTRTDADAKARAGAKPPPPTPKPSQPRTPLPGGDHSGFQPIQTGPDPFKDDAPVEEFTPETPEERSARIEDDFKALGDPVSAPAEDVETAETHKGWKALSAILGAAVDAGIPEEDAWGAICTTEFGGKQYVYGSMTRAWEKHSAWFERDLKEGKEKKAGMTWKWAWKAAERCAHQAWFPESCQWMADKVMEGAS